MASRASTVRAVHPTMPVRTEPKQGRSALPELLTLSLRMERHVENTAKVVEYLAGHAQVESVAHASLPTSPWHERANTYTRGRGYGSVPPS